MSAAGAIWAPVALRLLRVAFTKGSRAIRNKISIASKQPQQIRHLSNHTRQPLHASIASRTQRRVPRTKAFNTAQQSSWMQSLRRYVTTECGIPRFDRSKFPRSETASRVAQQSGRAPFASTLRPNLTGGALPRTAGGYSVGGGAGVRYFSHTPTAPAQVVNNVSQAMRAFCFSGQRARFDGVDSRGNAIFRAVVVEEEKKLAVAIKAPVSAPGSFVDFRLSPTVTALTPLAAAVTAFPGSTNMSVKKEAIAAATLNTEGVIDELALDFARAWKDLSVVFSDLRKLSELGDLPIILEASNLIRVRFPGVDAKTVERICDDLGIRRGLVGEDPEFDKALDVNMALKFPFAPGLETDSPPMVFSPPEEYLLSSGNSIEDMFFLEEAVNPWLSELSKEGYQSLLPRQYAMSLPSSGFHCSDPDSTGSRSSKKW